MIQRAIEDAGIPTVALANLPPRVKRVGYPRAALVKFPRGAAVGAPGDAAQQRQVLLDTFKVLETASAPGTPVELEHRWSGGRSGAA